MYATLVIEPLLSSDQTTFASSLISIYGGDECLSLEALGKMIQHRKLVIPVRFAPQIVLAAIKAGYHVEPGLQLMAVAFDPGYSAVLPPEDAPARLFEGMSKEGCEVSVDNLMALSLCLPYALRRAEDPGEIAKLCKAWAATLYATLELVGDHQTRAITGADSMLLCSYFKELVESEDNNAAG